MRVFVKANIYLLLDKNLNHRGSFVKRSFTCEKYSLEILITMTFEMRSKN